MVASVFVKNEKSLLLPLRFLPRKKIQKNNKYSGIHIWFERLSFMQIY